MLRLERSRIGLIASLEPSRQRTLGFVPVTIFTVVAHRPEIAGFACGTTIAYAALAMNAFPSMKLSLLFTQMKLGLLSNEP